MSRLIAGSPMRIYGIRILNSLLALNISAADRRLNVSTLDVQSLLKLILSTFEVVSIQLNVCQSRVRLHPAFTHGKRLAEEVLIRKTGFSQESCGIAIVCHRSIALAFSAEAIRATRTSPSSTRV
jgi:hypothetical protein